MNIGKFGSLDCLANIYNLVGIENYLVAQMMMMMMIIMIC